MTTDAPKKRLGRPPGPIPFDKKAHDRIKSKERRDRIRAEKGAKQQR